MGDLVLFQSPVRGTLSRSWEAKLTALGIILNAVA
jgi:hypothetical protein